jgi:DNA-binding beta-propeller fold protein YncE
MLYVACGDDGTITPIVVATNRPLPPVRVAPAWSGDPASLAVTPDSRTLYAASQGGTVVVIPAARP